jgi:hypothetical protein
MYKDWQTDTHHEERNGWPSVVSDALFQNVHQKICERQRFTILELSCEFPQISCCVLYEIITCLTVTSFAQEGFQKTHRHAQNA